MSSLQYLNRKADIVRKAQALSVNIAAAKGLENVLKTNLGPKGTIKMLVGGAGQIRLTKDGNVLLREMQIQHPTAAMIARASTAQDDIVGDGTTTTVLFIGELLKEAERILAEGAHPRTVVDGIELAKEFALKHLDEVKKEIKVEDTEMMHSIARNSLMTKIHPDLANGLVEPIVDAVSIIKKEDGQIDLHMVELMHMQHKLSTDSRLVRGIVMDHGGRHPSMPKKLENCYIMTLNVSLEYEKTEVFSGFFWKDADEREKLVKSERSFTDNKVMQIIALKRKLCLGTDKNFVIINQKGIDPPSLDMLAKEKIIALRRAKRRNMERLVLACGGSALNSLDDVCEEDLGYAKHVYEHELNEEKYTFIEGVENPRSCTLLIKGPNDYSIAQTKDAIRDGLRAVKNAHYDLSVVPGAGGFEISAARALRDYAKKEVTGKVKLGIECFANALLMVPKTLASNSGFDQQDTMFKVMEACDKDEENKYGIDVYQGEPLACSKSSVWDNYVVKKQFLNIAPSLAQQLLLVDEIMRAGKGMPGVSEADGS